MLAVNIQTFQKDTSIYCIWFRSAGIETEETVSGTGHWNQNSFRSCISPRFYILKYAQAGKILALSFYWST